LHHTTVNNTPLSFNIAKILAAAKMTMTRRRLRAPTVLISSLTVLVLASSSSAIDSSKNNSDQKAVDNAIANAKKLVDDMNYASTGTVTSYQGNREPVKCNDMMAKTLVLANAEKASVIQERDSLVKAASLLSDRIVGLEKQLEASNREIEALKGAWNEADCATGETHHLVEKAQREADEKVAAILSQAAAEKEEAARLIEDLKMQIVHRAKQMAHKLEQEKANTEVQIKLAHEYAGLRVKYIQDRLEERKQKGCECID
jgi:hypothetical protein